MKLASIKDLIPPLPSRTLQKRTNMIKKTPAKTKRKKRMKKEQNLAIPKPRRNLVEAPWNLWKLCLNRRLWYPYLSRQSRSRKNLFPPAWGCSAKSRYHTQERRIPTRQTSLWCRTSKLRGRDESARSITLNWEPDRIPKNGPCRTSCSYGRTTGQDWAKIESTVLQPRKNRSRLLKLQGATKPERQKK